ncbi:transglutaminase family protein [Ramlibacter terrae]|uniref:Transglutaminase family protein n=1 Tax=Ramlibacter terrae TaxID=2732511 RepID=A0ABX6P7I3_9BURK|nr:transglutaminase family protein [Ramlibacter terrae]
MSSSSTLTTGAPSPELDDPGQWLGSSPLLDLEDPRLRLRAQALTQLAAGPREKTLVVYGFVKRLPFAKPFKMRLYTAREVLDNARGDSADKATLLVALLRLAGVPARIRYLTLGGEIMRGLLAGMPEPTRPVVEVFRRGRWIGTDTYIFDAPYYAAALRRLQDNRWAAGYGIHVEGHALWDGANDAYGFGRGDADDTLVLADHGVFCDPLEFVSSPSYRASHNRLPRALQWNLFSPAMDRAIRDLRSSEDRP